METDELFEEAREIFSTAWDISQFLRLHIGTMASNYSNENEYLQGVLEFIKSVSLDQTSFKEEWSVKEPLDQEKLELFVKRIEEIIALPEEQRTYEDNS